MALQQQNSLIGANGSDAACQRWPELTMHAPCPGLLPEAATSRASSSTSGSQGIRRRAVVLHCAAAGRAMLASLAAAPLLVKPALAQEADAVDSAVDNLTSVIKVCRGCHPVAQQQLRGPRHAAGGPQSMSTLPVRSAVGPSHYSSRQVPLPFNNANSSRADVCLCAAIL